MKVGPIASLHCLSAGYISPGNLPVLRKSNSFEGFAKSSRHLPFPCLSKSTLRFNLRLNNYSKYHHLPHKIF